MIAGPNVGVTVTCACGKVYTGKTYDEVAEKRSECWSRSRQKHTEAQARKRGVRDNGKGWI